MAIFALTLPGSHALFNVFMYAGLGANSGLTLFRIKRMMEKA